MSDSIKIPVKSLNLATELPRYAYSGDAGFDLKSSIKCNILPGQRHVVKCGFCIEIPDGYAGLVLPRSGLAAKHGITVLNSPGLIDSGYRGEIMVVLLNTDTQNEFEINIGDRIAQMMIVSFAKCYLNEVDELSLSDRKNSGFGSSGVK